MSEGDVLALLSPLERRLGVSFAGPRRERLLEALEKVRSDSRLPSYQAMRDALDDDVVHDRVVAALTVGETYFFRERAHLELLREEILPAMASSHGGRLRLWSAGCASGEEAYSLAMVAEQAGLAERCAVIGTDLSAAAVERARAAVYRSWSLRALDELERRRWFHHSGSRFRLDERVRERVSFVRHNLMDAPPAPGRFHAVFCRNVLIYMTPEAVLRAAAAMRDALAPGGWLITASGDPPLEAEGLQRVRTSHGLAYRRAASEQPLPGHRLTPSPRSVAAAARSATGGSAPRRTPPRAVHPGTCALPGPRPAAAERTDDGPEGRVEDPDTGAVRIRALGDAGRLEEATTAAAAAVEAHPLDPELRYLSAVIALERGDLSGAAAAAKAAVYLGADVPAAHILLGQIEHARGNASPAVRSFRNAERLLLAAAEDDDVELLEGVPVAHLAALTARYLGGREGAGS